MNIEFPEHLDVYEQIIQEKRQIVLNPTSEYAELKQDDYLNAEFCIWICRNYFSKKKYL